MQSSSSGGGWPETPTGRRPSSGFFLRELPRNGLLLLTRLCLCLRRDDDDGGGSTDDDGGESTAAALTLLSLSGEYWLNC
jgi:hypothetical protein